jgi:hypothetical protein
VGKPLLAGVLVAAEQRLVGRRTSVWIGSQPWLRFIAAKHRSIGLSLARAWGLPAVVGRSIADAADYDLREPRSVANAVRLANALAKLKGLYVGEFDRDDTQSLSFVGQQLFGLEAAATERLLAGVGDEVRRRTQ